jgi:hypothetical protein
MHAAAPHCTWRGQFSLQRCARFATFEDVRMIVAIGTLLIGASMAFAQEQERHLIDRILKPDMTMANPAQNKKFSETQGSSMSKPARTSTFYSSSKTIPKTFPQQDRVLTPQQFAARHFRAGDSEANISTRSRLTRNDTVIPTSTATAGTRVAVESTTTAAPARQFADNRQFLEKGKSQKSLQTQNKPLTIEQVRELLNKSK